MKENISLNIPQAKFAKSSRRNQLFTERKQNSAFKVVVPDVEIMICCETLVPSRLERDLIQLEREYKSDFRTQANLTPNYNYVI